MRSASKVDPMPIAAPVNVFTGASQSMRGPYGVRLPYA
jgi:hypothetical protein